MGAMSDDEWATNEADTMLATYYTVRDLGRKVRRGARYMDKEQPDWFNVVVPGRLRMNDGTFCVFGQAFGDYGKHLSEIERSEDWADDHGFVVAGPSVDYRILDAFWVAAIWRRKHKAGLVDFGPDEQINLLEALAATSGPQ